MSGCVCGTVVRVAGWRAVVVCGLYRRCVGVIWVVCRIGNNVVYLAMEGGNGVLVEFGFEIIVCPFQA